MEQTSRAVVCFIGIDGSGKTTHALNLCKELLVRGIQSVYVRPEYTLTRCVPPILRRYTLKYAPGSPDRCVSPGARGREGLRRAIIELVLSSAIFVDIFITYFLKIRIIPKEFIVVCDRYFFDWINDRHRWVSLALSRVIPKPDLTFLLDIPSLVAFSRMHDVYDRKRPSDYYRRKQIFYLTLAEQLGFIIVNTGRDFGKVEVFILNHVTNLLQGRGYVRT